MIITALLALLFLEILIAILSITNVIIPDMINKPVLKYTFQITKEGEINRLTFNPFFELGIAILFGSFPFITFLRQKNRRKNNSDLRKRGDLL